MKFSRFHLVEQWFGVMVQRGVPERAALQRCDHCLWSGWRRRARGILAAAPPGRSRLDAGGVLGAHVSLVHHRRQGPCVAWQVAGHGADLRGHGVSWSRPRRVGPVGAALLLPSGPWLPSPPDDVDAGSRRGRVPQTRGCWFGGDLASPASAQGAARQVQVRRTLCLSESYRGSTDVLVPQRHVQTLDHRRTVPSARGHVGSRLSDDLTQIKTVQFSETRMSAQWYRYAERQTHRQTERETIGRHGCWFRARCVQACAQRSSH